MSCLSHPTSGPWPTWLGDCYPALEELDLSNNRVRQGDSVGHPLRKCVGACVVAWREYRLC